MGDLPAAFAAIDAANAADPSPDATTGRPAALLYGERMSAELDRLAPAASEVLKIAARGQHIERWLSPRSGYPDGRDGYLAWRTALAGFHARRVGEIMAAAGYGEPEREAAGGLLRKERLKEDPDAQLLEDVICFVFVRHYLAPFMAKRGDDELRRILGKTARKMSAAARARMAAEFDIPADLAPALARR